MSSLTFAETLESKVDAFISFSNRQKLSPSIITFCNASDDRKAPEQIRIQVCKKKNLRLVSILNKKPLSAVSGMVLVMQLMVVKS